MKSRFVSEENTFTFSPRKEKDDWLDSTNSWLAGFLSFRTASDFFNLEVLAIHNFKEGVVPRVPAGNPAGGQWTDGAVGTTVKYKPNKMLTPEHSAIEKKFGDELDKNYEYYKNLYLKTHPNIISVDDLKEFSQDYQLNRGELSSAVHEPASAMAKMLYEELLAKDPVTNTVIFMAGGTGSGKTSGISVIPKVEKSVLQADIVYDTNLSNIENSRKKIEQALASGRNVTILYVYRDPVEAFENGVIPRMKRMGRAVPIEQHIKTHSGSFYTSLVLRNLYKKNPRVNVIALDNSNGRGGAALISFGNLAKKAYFNRNLYEQLYDSARSKKSAGTITEQQYRGLTGEGYKRKIVNQLRDKEIAARGAIELLRQSVLKELE